MTHGTRKTDQARILVLLAEVSELTALSRECWDRLSPADQNRALGMPIPLARKQFVAARFLAMRAAAELFPGRASFHVLSEPGGKPSLLSPEGKLELSISHSGNLVAVAVSSAGRVGLDVELSREISPAELDSVFTKHEQSCFVRNSPEESRKALMSAWCAKEAAAKFQEAQQVLDPRQLSTASCADFEMYPSTLVLADEIYFLCLAHERGAGMKIQLKKESALP